jgi:hypothetical protein
MRLFLLAILVAIPAVLQSPTSAEAQITDVDCVAIVDSVGTRVARATQSDNGQQPVFNLGHNGLAIPFNFNPAPPFIHGTQDQVWFTNADCSSTPFVNAGPDFPAPISVAIGGNVYYSQPNAAVQHRTFLARRREGSSGGSCELLTDVRSDMAPASLQFTLPDYKPPFYIEPEACYTPDPSVAALTPYSLGAMAFLLAFGAYLMVARAHNAGGQESA